MLPGLLALLGVYTLGAGVRYGNMLLMNRMVSRHYTCAIRIRMSDKIQRLPVKFVDSTPVGQILEQMTDDVFCHGQFHSSDCGHPDAGAAADCVHRGGASGRGLAAGTDCSGHDPHFHAAVGGHFQRQ